MLSVVLGLIVAFFPVSEVMLARARRARNRAAWMLDRGSLGMLWLAVGIGMIAAMSGQFVRGARLPLSGLTLIVPSLALLAGGLALRWTAILTLGDLFTVDVAVREDQPVVARGPYRFVRHPSYTGLLLAFAGVGLLFRSWLSLLGLLVPVAIAVANRIAKEERALEQVLGSRYASYCAGRKRLIPGVL